MPPSYDELVPFDPDEFATAFQWALNAAEGKAHLPNPVGRRFSVPDEEGELVSYHFADRLETRMIMAMLERYGKTDPQKYHSALARIFALIQLVQEGGLEPWVRPIPGDPDHTEIADAVVAAAAVAPLDEWLRFPILQFMHTVRQIEADAPE